MNSIKMWIDLNDEALAQATQNLKDRGHKYMRTAEDNMCKILLEIRNKITADLSSVFDFGLRTSEWEEAASNEFAKYAKWNASQYRAWCRRKGDHKTKAAGAVNWNNDFIWTMRTELELAFEQFRENFWTFR